MATNWVDFYSKCPYFIRSSNKKISCTGVTDGVKISWEFDKKEDKEIQMRVFCCEKYNNCEVFRMLKEIYEEE